MKSDFRKFVDSAQALPPDVVLGSLVFWTINDGDYDISQIEKSFDDLMLNPSMLPPSIKSINAFERATSEMDKKQYGLNGNNLTATLLIREKFRDDEVARRQITREVREIVFGGTKSARKAIDSKLAYDNVGEFVFYKPAVRGGKVQRGSERLRVTLDSTKLWPEERPILDALIKDVAEHFDRYNTYLDGQKIRGILRDYAGYLNGVLMKSGVYFIHASRTDEVERLQTFVRSLGCQFVIIPIPDLKALREDVIEAYQTEAVKELEEVVKAISKLRGTRQKINESQYVKIKAQYEGVMRKATEYSRTLKVDQERTAGAAEIALDSLLALESDVRKTVES